MLSLILSLSPLLALADASPVPSTTPSAGKRDMASLFVEVEPSPRVDNEVSLGLVLNHPYSDMASPFMSDRPLPLTGLGRAEEGVPMPLRAAPAFQPHAVDVQPVLSTWVDDAAPELTESTISCATRPQSSTGQSQVDATYVPDLVIPYDANLASILAARGQLACCRRPRRHPSKS